jgi:suppressor of ftsI
MRRRAGRSAVVVGVASLALALMVGSCSDDETAPAAPEFENPPELVSRDGVLEATFTVETAQIDVAGKQLTTQLYNGLYVPPTLRVRRGDTIKLHLKNRISQQTNAHYHGMNVSPLGNSDNVFVHVLPDRDFDYTIDIPDTHPQGLFYYHPHLYGLTEAQIMGGMSGLLVVDGLLDPFPELAGITELQMQLKDTQIVDGALPDDIDPSAPTNHTLNGQVNPTIRIRPGELQLWRIGNIGADLYYPLVLEGHPFYEIARDGNRRTRLTTHEQILLPPSSRFEVLVRGGAPGTYLFKSLDFDTGPVGDSYPGVTLATVVVGGDPVDPIPLPTDFPPVPDLRSTPVQIPRTIVFDESEDGNTFFIDGKMFDPDRIDTPVTLGTTEVWTIKNCTQELHVFHIHQLDFQVVEINGVEQPFLGRQDTVDLPYATDEGPDDEDCQSGTPGVVTVIIPFTDPTVLGKFVYHCHIGEHEDNGMMATIEVREPDGVP